jgi:hypothetical protein
MKNSKAKVWVAALFIASVVAVPAAAGAAEMKAMFDYSKVETIMENGMTLVPLRAAAESLGYKVQWNDMDRSVMLTMEQPMMEKPMTEKPMTDKSMEDKSMMDKPMMDSMSSIVIRIGSNKATVNGMEIMMASSAVIKMDMTYVSRDLIDSYLMQDGAMK